MGQHLNSASMFAIVACMPRSEYTACFELWRMLHDRMEAARQREIAK